jgi:hypothetical protein
VQSPSHQDREIRALGCIPYLGRPGDHREVFCKDRESKVAGIVSHNVDRPLGVIQPGSMPVKVDQGDVFKHRSTKTSVVRVARIVTAVAIVNSLIRRLVLIWSFPARNLGYGRDAQRQVADSWLEDSLRSEKRHPAPVEFESLLQKTSRENKPSVQS